MYIPLKVTTDYSLLKSLIKIPNLINFLTCNNISACGICDDNLYGVFDFYFNCKSNNIKPIIGLNAQIFAKDIYLYAMNYQGFLNLLKINTLIEKNILDIEKLKEYKDNILMILPFSSLDLLNDVSFGPKLYLGYHTEEEKIKCLEITDNSVYVENIKVLNPEDLKYLKYLDLIRKEEPLNYTSNYYHDYKFIDKEKIKEVVSFLNVEIPLDNYHIPKYNKDINSEDFLRKLALKGLTKRLNKTPDSNYLNRLNYELDIISNMGFVDYFLIVYDYVLYAKKNNILVGPGRGSAAGSLVSYSIGITDIDPLKYDLLFERFLNPARVTMPDIDVDFDATKREDVIKYVKNKYGHDNVALGLTFNTLKSRLVLREVGKITKISPDLLEKFIGNINSSLTLKENLENNIIKKYIDNYPSIKDLYLISMHLEGLKKNTSIHAAGVVISSVKLDEVIPIHYENNTLITGVTLEYLEKLGLLKMDFLGIKNLTTIANILSSLKTNVLKDISLNDPKVFALFASGKTEGIFQFETNLMKNLIVRLKPTSFEDLVAGVALGRPGPRSQAEEYILRKNKIKNITYIDDSLEDILKSTYGILIYQEQILSILKKVGGYSYKEADLIRRAISKKKEEIIKKEEENFVKRAIQNGYDAHKAKIIYGQIAEFASYGFNKSHSVAYALIAYQMAYLKVYYPAHYLIEMLNNKDNNFNEYISYLKSKDIFLIKPNVNYSKENFYIYENKLIMPLWQIKNISKELANKIIYNRGEKYSDLCDFCYKNKEFINKDNLTILIKGGALDNFNLTRNALLKNIDSALNYASLADDSGLIKKPLLVEMPEYSEDILRQDELDSYGFYISNHPSIKYKTSDITKLEHLKENVFKKVKMVVLIEKINQIKTKKNENMAFLSASDETAFGDFTLFPANYNMLTNIKIGDLVFINGEVTKRFDKYSIIINNIRKVG